MPGVGGEDRGENGFPDRSGGTPTANCCSVGLSFYWSSTVSVSRARVGREIPPLRSGNQKGFGCVLTSSCQQSQSSSERQERDTVPRPLRRGREDEEQYRVRRNLLQPVAFSDGREHIVGAGQDFLLKAPAVGPRNVYRADTHYRTVEPF